MEGNITLPDLPYDAMLPAAATGAVAGWFWQHFRGVSMYVNQGGEIQETTRPSLRAEKIVNAAQGAVLGIDALIVLDTLLKQDADLAVVGVAFLALPFLLKMAYDTDRMPRGYHRGMK